MTNPFARLLVSSMLAGCAATAVAQTAFVPGGTRSRDGQFLFSNGAIMTFGELNVAGASLSTVTGHPYSAEQSIDWEDTLNPAAATWRTWQTRLYRDSDGRTRAETTVVWAFQGANPPLPHFVEIIDPVAGYRYLLSPANKTAYRSVWPMAIRSEQVEQRRNGERIGERTIEGVLSEGIRIKRLMHSDLASDKGATYIASTEEWSSSELQILVLREEDTACSKTRFRLTDIDRSEPVAALFRVPDDFLIVDQSQETWWSVNPVGR